jgi:tRNA dimethylallyltransferase
MDIGTAKPTVDEQRRARHWVVDAVAPDERFTLAMFLDLASAAMRDIGGRGRLPIVAGGTGQYVWALLEGWRVPRVPPDRRLRGELEAVAAREGREALFQLLRAEDPGSSAEIDPRNVRRVIRALEVTRATGRPFSSWREKVRPEHGSLVVGLRMPRADLYRRIDERVEAMMAAGLVEEVRRLNAAGYDCELPSMSGIGYRQICEHLAGRCRLEDAVARIKTETHRLARMQHTWFRENDARICWLDAATPGLGHAAATLIERAVTSG